MRSTALFLSLVLCGAQCASRTAHASGPGVRQPKADLDLNADFDEPGPPLPPKEQGEPPRRSPRAWIYWTAAAGALAAAGGLGWYWHRQSDAVRTVRDELVFTDER